MSTTTEAPPEEIDTEPVVDETTQQDGTPPAPREEAEQPTDEQIQLEHLAEIKSRTKIVLSDKACWEMSKEETADLKKVYDKGVDSLLAFTNRQIQLELPFGDTENIAATEWESLPLSAAGIDGGRADKMIEAGIDTLGKIAGATLTDIKGFGPEAEAWVGDQMMKFWPDHPEFCQDDDGDESDVALPGRIKLLCDLPSASKENMLYEHTEFNVVDGDQFSVTVKGMDDEEYVVSNAEYVVIDSEN